MRKPIYYNCSICEKIKIKTADQIHGYFQPKIQINRLPERTKCRSWGCKIAYQFVRECNRWITQKWQWCCWMLRCIDEVKENGRNELKKKKNSNNKQTQRKITLIYIYLHCFRLVIKQQQLLLLWFINQIENKTNAIDQSIAYGMECKSEIILCALNAYIRGKTYAVCSICTRLFQTMR